MKIKYVFIIITLFSSTAYSAGSDILKTLRKPELPKPRHIDVQPKPVYKDINAVTPHKATIKTNITTKPLSPNMQAKNFRYTNHQPPNKVLNQRGWTTDQINQIIEQPYTIRAAKHKFNNNSPATAYFRKDGHHIVIDNMDKRLVHMSNTNLRIGKGDKDKYWKTNDEIIIKPYIPKGAVGY